MEIRVHLGELVTDQKFGVAPKKRLREVLSKLPAIPADATPVLVIDTSSGINTFPALLIVAAQDAFDELMAERPVDDAENEGLPPARETVSENENPAPPQP